ncbi:MAG: glycosyltransferase [Actinomycetia bacterium]|nr:glycosyltransferase [Actinomycetes bacterium]
MIDPSRMTPNYDASLCEALAHSGCEVTLHVRRGRPGEPGLTLEAATNGHVFYRVTEWLRERLGARPSQILKPIEHIIDLLRMLRRLRSERPEVVHIQWLVIPLLDRLFIEAIKRSVAPVIVTVHDTNTLHGVSRFSPQSLGMTGALNAANALVVHTNHSIAQLGERPSGQQVALTPHAVWEVPRSATPEDGVLRILMFGRIREYKGVDVLVEALGMIDSSLRVRALVAGDPMIDTEPLQKRSAELGLDDRIEWQLRFLDDDETHAAFNSADVVALPYRDIDASGVLCQAFGYGVPIVATRIGGFVDQLVDGDTALLIEPESPAELARALERLASDRDLADHLRRRLEEEAAENTWDAQARSTRDLYDVLLAGSRR